MAGKAPQNVKKKAVTSIDVAKLAGVSQPTVSRAMNPESKLSAELRERVMKAAETLGYTPNAMARSLKGAKANIIALLIIESTTYYYKVITGIARRLQERGYQILLFSIEPDHHHDAEYILKRISEYCIDGVIITGALQDSNLIYECYKRNIPCVLYGRTISKSLVSSVTCDNVKAGKQVAEYFLKQGRYAAACIYGDLSSSTSIDRMNAFLGHMQEFSPKACISVKGGWTYQDGKAATLALFEKNTHIDGIFCVNIDATMGCLDALRYHLNYKVPDEIAVVGFDDIPIASGDSYNITTMVQPTEQMIEATINTLLSHIDGTLHDIVNLTFEGSMVVRKST